MQSLIANISWPELLCLLVLFLLILGANEIPEMLKGKRHAKQKVKQAIRELRQEVVEVFETGAARDDRNVYRLHQLIFWLFAALVLAMGVMALGFL